MKERYLGMGKHILFCHNDVLHCFTCYKGVLVRCFFFMAGYEGSCSCFSMDCLGSWVYWLQKIRSFDVADRLRGFLLLVFARVSIQKIQGWSHIPGEKGQSVGRLWKVGIGCSDWLTQRLKEYLYNFPAKNMAKPPRFQFVSLRVQVPSEKGFNPLKLPQFTPS